MKYFLFLSLLAFMACTKNSSDCNLGSCTGTCLFTLENQEAITLNIQCYGQYGYSYYDSSTQSNVLLLPDEMPDELQQDSLSVTLCGYARENQIPFQFPDPPGPLAYQFITTQVISGSK